VKPKAIHIRWRAILGLFLLVTAVAAEEGPVREMEGNGACGEYLVFAPPLVSPDLGDRALEICPADPVASPFGWHDTDGVDGSEFTDTQGNNVVAQEDRDGNNVGGFRPDGGPLLEFDFPLDLDLPPEASTAASVTQGFYLINRLHDLRYRYGFDESSGNFQENNYGGGGLDGDRITLDVQDPFGQLTFSVPPDGFAPGRLQIPEIPPIGPRELPRDGAYDNALVAHGYGHGVSIRLTGGPGNVSCLFNAEQMGEGWSDFDGLWFTASADDLPNTPRGIGNYSLFEPPDGPGIRQYPYTTDLSLNPLTYDDIKTIDAPFGVGTIWASMLWEVYWNLVEKYGYDSDLATGTGGNNITMSRVTDGLKLQPCLPHFVDGRDAILDADLIATGGVDRCEIWRGFAKRGLGVSANAGSSSSVTDGSEAFDTPLECGPVVDASGSCPGAVTLRASGLAGSVSLFVAGSEPGSSVIPSGPCAGTLLGIAGPRPLSLGPTAADGTRTLEGNLGVGSCGEFVQVVDGDCRVSSVSRIPLASSR